MDTKQLYLRVKDDIHSWKWWSSWLVITLGCTILALGFILFMFPYKITPGGIWGMSTILHELFPAIPQGWFGYMMDIPLLLMGFAVFGPVFGTKTVFASLITPLLMLLLPYAIYPDIANQTAETLLWGRLNLADDLILATIFGGIFIGAGVGLVVRAQATTGGTDIIAMLLQKYTHIKFSNGILIADAFVVACGLVVLVGMKGESPTLPLYSLLTIYIAVQIIDLVVEGRNYDKMLLIITDRQSEVREFILTDLNRGGTVIRATGMYTGKEKEMVFLVVSRREIVPVKQRLRDIDPGMFVVVVDANETLGEGFRPFSEMKNT
ncbi:MAG: YitT family protein [Alistipes sp.]|nr:YitT family protein [Alistipes sp.]